MLPPNQYPICHIILANHPSEYISDLSLSLSILLWALLLHSLISGLLQQFPGLLCFYLYYLHALLHPACKYLTDLHASLYSPQTLWFLPKYSVVLLITHFLYYLPCVPSWLWSLLLSKNESSVYPHNAWSFSQLLHCSPSSSIRLLLCFAANNSLVCKDFLIFKAVCMCVSLRGQELRYSCFTSPTAPSILLGTVFRTWLIDASDPNFTLPCQLSFSPVGIVEWSPSGLHFILQKKQKPLSENVLTFLPFKISLSPSILLVKKDIFLTNAKVNFSTRAFDSTLSHLPKFCCINCFLFSPVLSRTHILQSSVSQWALASLFRLLLFALPQ